MRLYEFRDQNDRIEPGFSGSPICIEPRSRSDTPMCIGMLNARRIENVSRHGFVIPFDVIDSACRHLLPFHRYASCVIVVLAANRDELEALRSLLSQDVLNRLPNYHKTSRDEWRPFRLEDPTIKKSLDELSSQLPSWQLASDYLDQDDGSFREYLAERHLGPLVYLIDPCSMNVEAIRAVVQHASNTNRGARYICALCATIDTSTRGGLKIELQSYLGRQFWEDPHSNRLDLAEDPHSFRNRVREGVRNACEQFMREYYDHPSHSGAAVGGSGVQFRRMDWSHVR
jgi:hypothetical protein